MVSQIWGKFELSNFMNLEVATYTWILHQSDQSKNTFEINFRKVNNEFEFSFFQSQSI